jgi:HK97 family phage portal protein
MSLLNSFRSWWGRDSAIAETRGTQAGMPAATLIPDVANVGVDGALQISAVWACVSLRANLVASLPFFAYETMGGEKKLARGSRLYALLKDSPNSRMTPFEFWRAMMMNYDLRGNAYARIDRDGAGEALAMWPMPAGQVEPKVLPDGSMVYLYTVGNDVAVLASENVLHLKNLGNGTVGLSKLEFMRSTTDEAAKAQGAAGKLFGNGGKPTGVLMLDKVLDKEQRLAVKRNFEEMSEGGMSRLFVLEANMKYEQVSMSPADQQLLETRKFNLEEICRWFDVPAVLVNHAGLIQYGNNDVVEDIFYKTIIMPLLENVEQAFRKRVMTSRQRATMVCETSMDALLRGSAAKRAEIYAKSLQNGWLTRAEVRQLEGWPHIEGSDALTAQSNLVPLAMLGKIKPASGGNGDNVAQ